MPKLSDPRWEIACQERAAGGDIAASYKAAGYTGRPSAATNFFQRPEIVERVQEIIQQRYDEERKSREIATQEAGIDKAWILKRIKYLTDLSLQKKEVIKAGRVVGYGAMDGPTAVKCLTLAAHVGGLMVHRHEIGQPGDFARMSDDELNSSLIDQAKALGLPETAIDQLMAMQGGSETRQ